MPIIMIKVLLSHLASTSPRLMQTPSAVGTKVSATLNLLWFLQFHPPLEDSISRTGKQTWSNGGSARKTNQHALMEGNTKKLNQTNGGSAFNQSTLLLSIKLGVNLQKPRNIRNNLNPRLSLRGKSAEQPWFLIPKCWGRKKVRFNPLWETNEKQSSWEIRTQANTYKHVYVHIYIYICMYII